MNALAEARYEQAIMKLDIAIDMLAGSMEQVTRESLMRARGDLIAMKQLLDLEETLREQATTPAPSLRLVK